MLFPQIHPKQAPSSTPFWLLLLLLLLLNSLLSGIQTQDSELKSQGGAFQDHKDGPGSFTWIFKKDLIAFNSGMRRDPSMVVETVR